ncbi:thiamine pyrophosphate-binding protein [Candidatus Poriferisodalis sp.]|uniref:thiamine pyrophosphate-binding protein n=1 Tax=Candidatus Poriferisodalis sp. TaxID=3101277 RepID=UPI003B528DD0
MSQALPRNGGDLLVEMLGSLGIDAAFGVVSVHNLPLVDAVAHGMRWVPTRSEAASVNAADGYARVRGTPGCAVTSTGTGAANAAGALVEALTAGSPVLHVTGQIPSEHLGAGRGVIHETRDQLGMLRSCSVWATTVGAAPSVDFAEAARRLGGHPRGPVSLEWPIDLQYGQTEPFDAITTDSSRHTVGAPESDNDALESGAVLGTAAVPGLDEAALDRAAEFIAAAKRPVVWAGGGAIGCSGGIDRLLHCTGAGLFTSNAGRGVLPESDDRVIGNFAASATGAELLDQADVLISVGTHFRSNETRSYRLALPRWHIQIDIDPAAIGRSYPAEVGIVGDARKVVDALVGRLADHLCAPQPDWNDRITAARDQCRAQLRRDIGPYAAICDIMAGVLSDRSPRVRDITIPNSSWGNRLLPVMDPSTNVVPRGGGIGQAVGMSIGASVARADEPTMVMVGDGGLVPQLGEMATLAQEELPVTVVVFDDGGYGVLRNTQDRHLGRRSGVDLRTPDLAAAAAAFDFGYFDVATPNEFADAFESATAAGHPQMIRVDCDALGPMPVPFVPPVEMPSSADR